MDHDFWMRACSAAFGRPLTELQQANSVAGSVAVSFDSSASAHALTGQHRVDCCLLLSGVAVRICCSVERCMLRAAAPAAALAAARVGGCGGPDMEAPGPVQRLDVRWRRRGRRCIRVAHERIYVAV